MLSTTRRGLQPVASRKLCVSHAPCLCGRLIRSLLFPAIAGALLAAKPQAASQAGAAEARQVTLPVLVFATEVRPILLALLPMPWPRHTAARSSMDSLQAADGRHEWERWSFQGIAGKATLAAAA